MNTLSKKEVFEMKNVLVVIFLGIALFTGNIINNHFITAVEVKAENVIPPYAKWGKLAMQKTKEKYPNAAILDYLHIGRNDGTKSSIEKFKLWLKENDKEFGVLVDIEFEKETERIIKITFKKVNR
jgi:hypothetical protein